MASLKAYGKVNEADQARLEACRKTRKRITVISLSSLLLLAIVVAAVVGTQVTSNKSDPTNNVSGDKSISASVKAVCDVTLYKDSCYSSLDPVADPSQLDPKELFRLSIQVALNEVSKAAEQFLSSSTGKNNYDNFTIAAIEDCQTLLSLAIDHLNDSLSSSATLDGLQLDDLVDDLRSWLSTAGTSCQTCVDGLEEANLKALISQNTHLSSSSQLISNSLAIITWIGKVASSINMRRRLMDANENMPTWLHPKQRKLLTQSSDLKKKANIVVAKDGSGKYKTIQAALEAVPDKKDKRFIIYVKKGAYFENVRVEKSKWNVLIVGDGMNTTVVYGSRNFVDGTPTFQTSTFAVFGKGFVAVDMGFINTAGAIKHQAVALMTSADQSVFYRCSIDGYQDSLYAHSNRQFYRECNIYGTVDFIFGNSAVVLQNCNILPKRPMQGQQNTITAQGRIDPNQNTGITIQNCTIWPYGNLSSIQTFLGRPWKNYSTTVYMQNMMDRFIDPSGWLPWTGNTAPPTIFYAEFENYGGGASTARRVKWKGLKFINAKLAKQFTVHAFIKGDKWIPKTLLPYKPGL